MKLLVSNIFKSIPAILLYTLLPLAVFGQEERALTRQGNKEFNKGNYADAEANYKKALDKKNNFPEAIFNLGDAIYKQDNRYEEAVKQFELAAKMFTDSNQKAQAYHNLGNAQLSASKYQDAVDAYKNALKLNPTDKDTKYNLAYAQAKLKEQQQQQKQDNKDQKKEEEKKEDQKKPDQGDDKNKDQKDKENNQKGNKDKDKGQQPQPKLSKEAAEKLLQALQNEEQKTQEKMSKKMARPVEVKIEKDW